jgi:hypothetical protein
MGPVRALRHAEHGPGRGGDDLTQADVTGGCYCGAVRYRVRLDPDAVDTCYCRDCAGTVGSVVTVWAHVAAERFAFTHGDPVRFESSPGITRTFCGRCGSSLTYHYPDGADVDITTATLDDPDAFPPTSDGPGAPGWPGRLPGR